MVLFVFGIHIGMNFTTCAWSRSSRNSRELNSLIWKNALGLETTETPTIAKFTTDMKLQSFGDETETQIQTHNDDLLVFSDFVKQIFCEGHNIKDEVSAENGQTVSSKELMTEILLFILTKYPLQEYSTLYVLTVPSSTIDQIGARSFIKHVAKKAGMQNLLIIPEEVAVFRFCRESDILSGKEKSVSKSTKCIELECGDDNIKCSVVEEMKRHYFQITYQSFSQNPFFGEIQNKFEKILVNIFGKDVFEDFVRNYQSEYSHLVNDLRRKIYMSQRNRNVNIHLPTGLMNADKDVDDKNIRGAIQQSVYADCISYGKENILRISPDLFQNLLMDVGANVTNVIQDCLDSSRLSKVGSVIIIVVGNLGRSKILQNTIKYAFPSHHVVALDEPHLVVLKGAVIYGQERNSDTKMESEDEDEDLPVLDYNISSPAQCFVGPTESMKSTVGDTISSESTAGNTKSTTTSNAKRKEDVPQEFYNTKENVTEEAVYKNKNPCIIS